MLGTHLWLFFKEIYGHFREEIGGEKIFGFIDPAEE